MIIDIKYRATAYGDDHKNPEKPKLLYRNKLKRAVIDTEDIDIVSQYHNSRGKVDRNKCEIRHRTLGEILVEAPFEEIAEYKRSGRFRVYGFIKPKNRINEKSGRAK